MPFIRAASPSYLAPATFRLLDDAGHLVEQHFDVRCKRLKRSELEQLDADVAALAAADAGKRDRIVFDRVVVGWAAVQDASGADLPFTPAGVDALEEDHPGFIAACVRAFYLSTAPGQAAWTAAAKN